MPSSPWPSASATHAPASQHPAAPSAAAAAPAHAPAAGAADEVFAKLERLAELRDKGILSEEEFAAKKGELLARL